jgi:hypothetical protein
MVQMCENGAKKKIEVLLIYAENSAMSKVRRDETLLTAGFSLRKATTSTFSPESPAETAL